MATSSDQSDEQTATLRRFNRTYTQRIGALDESFLGTGRPLGPSRLLFEIGDAGRDRARAARPAGPRLRLPEPAAALARDRRPGRRAARPRRPPQTSGDPDPPWSHGVAPARREVGGTWRADLVAPLSSRQRERLTEALATADLLVRAATVRFDETAPDRPPRGGGDGGVLRRDRRAVRLRARRRLAAGRRVDGRARRLLRGRRERRRAGGVRGSAAAARRVRPRSSGCGSHDAWRGAGLGARLLRHLEDLRPRARPRRRPARHQRHAHRGDRDVRASGLPARSSATTTTRGRAAGSRRTSERDLTRRGRRAPASSPTRPRPRRRRRRAARRRTRWAGRRRGCRPGRRAGS